MPASATRYLITRRRKARASAGIRSIAGAEAATARIAFLSAAKLSLPPCRKSATRAALGTVTSIRLGLTRRGASRSPSSLIRTSPGHGLRLPA